MAMSLFVLETTNTIVSFDVTAMTLEGDKIITSKNYKLPEGTSFKEKLSNLVNNVLNDGYESLVFNIMDFDNLDRYIDALYELSKGVELSIGLRVKDIKNPSSLDKLGIPHIADGRDQEAFDLERMMSYEEDEIPTESPFNIARECCCAFIPTVDKSFKEKLINYINRSGKTNSEIYLCSGITKQVFSKIISNDTYQPKKSTIFCLIIGLELNLDDALDLLNAAGYTLSNSIIMDQVIKNCIERKRYDIIKVNDALISSGCPLIGWQPRD